MGAGGDPTTTEEHTEMAADDTERAPAVAGVGAGWTNVAVLSVGFFLIFNGYLVFQNFLTTLQKEMGNIYLSVLYLFSLIGTFFSAGLVSRLGVRNSMFLASLAYANFGVGVILENVGFLTLSSSLIGFSCAVLWTAHAVCISNISTVETKGRIVGIFWAFMGSSGVSGTFFVGLMIAAGYTYAVIFGILLVVCFCGSFCLLLLSGVERKVGDVAAVESSTEDSKCVYSSSNGDESELENPSFKDETTTPFFPRVVSSTVPSTTHLLSKNPSTSPDPQTATGAGPPVTTAVVSEDCADSGPFGSSNVKAPGVQSGGGDSTEASRATVSADPGTYGSAPVNSFSAADPKSHGGDSMIDIISSEPELCGPKSKCVDSTDDAKTPSGWTTLELMANPSMMLILPSFFTYGLIFSVMNSFMVPLVPTEDEEMRGFYQSIGALSSIVASLLSGQLMSCLPRVWCVLLFHAVFGLHLVFALVTLLHPTTRFWFYLSFISFGLADGGSNVQVFQVIPFFFPSQVADGFAAFNGSKSVGLALGFLIPLIFNVFFVYACCGVLIIGCSVCYAYLEWSELQVQVTVQPP
eukprot:gnl/Spiro4/17950_TR9570_c0_g1_i1.p1 gnl/Spiro4/17950_TR9570_c0_g1~~gnl/Spiro4/17950_TR9570_c0_g1_i1.p1  ORF type:complete len:579 (-),score=81.95 gnl/Spiro4/17950_TR9570_c0_g1_i1:57-1793(-)